MNRGAASASPGGYSRPLTHKYDNTHSTGNSTKIKAYVASVVQVFRGQRAMMRLNG